MLSKKVSVVIPTYNRGSYIHSCLKSLERQTMDNSSFEVIVVNDGSTDDTEEILSAFKESTKIDFRYITQPNRGVSAARNSGIKVSKGNYIAFTDDDCIVPTDWLEKLLSTIENAAENVVGVGGPLDNLSHTESNFLSRFLDYIDEFNYAPVIGKFFIKPVFIEKLTGNEQIAYLRTSNAIFKKKHLLEVGGFDESFKKPGGEDPDLCYRLISSGYKFLFNKEINVLHKSRSSWKAYLKSLKNYLCGERRVSSKKHLYAFRSIRNTYTFIPLLKIISFLASCLIFPYEVMKHTKKSINKHESFFFPLIVIIVKAYAIFLSIILYLRYKTKNDC